MVVSMCVLRTYKCLVMFVQSMCCAACLDCGLKSLNTCLKKHVWGMHLVTPVRACVDSGIHACLGAVALSITKGYSDALMLHLLSQFVRETPRVKHTQPSCLPCMTGQEL